MANLLYDKKCIKIKAIIGLKISKIFPVLSTFSDWLYCPRFILKLNSSKPESKNFKKFLAFKS